MLALEVVGKIADPLAAAFWVLTSLGRVLGNRGQCRRCRGRQSSSFPQAQLCRSSVLSVEIFGRSVGWPGPGAPGYSSATSISTVWVRQQLSVMQQSSSSTVTEAMTTLNTEAAAAPAGSHVLPWLQRWCRAWPGAGAGAGPAGYYC